MTVEATKEWSSPGDIVLIRLAIVTFTPPPKSWDKWSLEIDGVWVATRPHGGEQKQSSERQLVVAQRVLKYRPKVTKEGLVAVPEADRRQCEEAIETAANLVALAQGVRRYIRSPEPPVFLGATTEAGLAWLREQTGLQRGAPKTRMGVARDLDLDSEVVGELGDRFDGVALMVEAFQGGHATGRFHELIRLFERAFALPANRLTSAVAAFLSPDLGYSQAETAVWFEQLRDPATHADVRPQFVLESDVLPVIDRMEQAAVDVLLNKAVWRSPGSERRELWKPETGTSTADGSVFLTQGAGGTMLARILDEFGSFLIDFGAVLNSPPDGWWPPEGPSTTTSEADGNLQIRTAEAGPEESPVYPVDLD